MVSLSEWTDFGPPPLAVIQSGWPKKARRRDKDEGEDHGHKFKKRVVIHCRKCWDACHITTTYYIVAGSEEQIVDSNKEQIVAPDANPSQVQQTSI